MTSSILGRSLGLDLHVHYIDLKPRPLPNRNLRVRFRLQLINPFLNTCSHFRMQVLLSGYFHKHRWVSVSSITCLPAVAPIHAISRWTFVHRLASSCKRQESWLEKHEHEQQSHVRSNIQVFAVCNMSTYSMCHLGYVVLSF